MNLTPTQKLLRLKTLTIAISQPTPPENKPELMLEVAAILASATEPPPSLAESSHPAFWAEQFVASFPSLDFEVAQRWFEGLAANAHAAGRALGLYEGRELNAEALGMPRLVETLELIRDGLKANAIRSQGIVDIKNPSGPRRPLVERIVEDLAAVGVTE